MHFKLVLVVSDSIGSIWSVCLIYKHVVVVVFAQIYLILIIWWHFNGTNRWRLNCGLKTLVVCLLLWFLSYKALFNLNFLIIDVIFIYFVAHPMQNAKHELLIHRWFDFPSLQILNEGLLLFWTLFYIVELIIQRALIWFRTHELKQVMSLQFEEHSALPLQNEML